MIDAWDSAGLREERFSDSIQITMALEVSSMVSPDSGVACVRICTPRTQLMLRTGLRMCEHGRRGKTTKNLLYDPTQNIALCCGTITPFYMGEPWKPLHERSVFAPRRKVDVG